MRKYIPNEFEAKWTLTWEKENIYKAPDNPESTKKKYVLDMFPYPSGAGLHVGHVEGYTATDIYSRYLRMKGDQVLHPMGWDAFGLPAENYAIKNGVHPEVTTEKSIETFTSQIKMLGLSYDWSREIGTHRPEYYKWTQWLFLLLYKRGLAYRKEALVNWDPIDQTVLANEQVLPDGTAERSGARVEQRMLTQWFFKITDYAERLLNDLDQLDWPESTKIGQRNWIGKSVGTEIDFKLKTKNEQSVTIFTTRADTLFSAAFIAIAPESKILAELKSEISNIDELEKYVREAGAKNELSRQTEKDKTGVKLEGIVAVNPINGVELPVYVADFVLSTYGTGAIFGDAHDERDFEFAKKYDIPLTISVVPLDIELAQKVKNCEVCFTEYGTLINSGEFDGMTSADAKAAITKKLESMHAGKAKVTYRLRDWLISRQRFWGAPIPMKKIKKDGGVEYVPVAESELPVILPMDVDFKPTGQSPLTEHPDFQDREVDTMDTFVDSSWYFLRFCDPRNESEFADRAKMKAWAPVDLYVGGAEHTVLHLLYARFFTKVLHDAGYIDFDEPFLKLRHQGIILGSDSRKMSKRWGNVINPNDVIAEYGADSLRMYEMFMGPLDQMKAWNERSVGGVYRFLSRVWRLYQQDENTQSVGNEGEDKQLLIKLNKTIKKVGEDIEELKFNTAVAAMMELLNALEAGVGKGKFLNEANMKKFLQILAPFAPYLTEELWHEIYHENSSIHKSVWPAYDSEQIQDTEVKIPVQINGKIRLILNITNESITKEDIVKLTLEDEKIKAHLDGKTYEVIYVPCKILSFVVKG